MLVRGVRLGPYEIDSLIGQGGMGQVFRGRDSRLRRSVAIKVLAPHLVKDADAIARFRREAETASALNHPNILTIYDIGETQLSDGAIVHYIAMEFVEGRTLRDAMKTGPLDQQLEWTRQVAIGLSKAHAAGVTHRDLKPDNVMITDDGFAKILDFGLAKLTESPAGDGEATRITNLDTMAGTVLGTAGYMSPEQASGKGVDFRSDIFSLGCMLYEIAAGRAPFLGESVVDTLHAVIHREPPPLVGNLPPGLDRIVYTCLNKRPEQRFRSAAEIAGQLNDVIAEAAGKPLPRPLDPQATTTASNSERSIAVLPFADLSPGHDADYIGDGLADEISSDLSRLHSLRVTARTSAVHYRNTELRASHIARELGVEFVLTGSVRVAGERLRITTQLVEASTDRAIWVDKTDGRLDDIFDIQEKVARAVTDALKVRVSSEESGALRERPIPNVRAFECYLKARRYIWEMTEASLQHALDEIDRAEALIGENNPLLLALKGYVYWQYYNAGIRPDPKYLDMAEVLANRVMAIDPASANVDLLRGLILMQRSDFVAAIRYLRRAVEKDGNVEALTWLPVALALVGANDEARLAVERLRRVDPLSWMAHIGPLAIEYYAGNFTRAAELAAELRPDDIAVPLGGFIVVETYVQAGRLQDAAAVAKSMAERDPSGPFTKMALSLTAALEGRTADARDSLSDDVLTVARADLQYSSWVAELYALLNDRDAALDWLRHSIEKGFVNYPFFAVHDQLIRNLHGDLRFTTLMNELQVKWRAANRT